MTNINDDASLDMGDETGIQKSSDGRSREARAARAAQQAGEEVQSAAPSARGVRRGARTQQRDIARSPARNGAIVKGRDGEVLSRTVPDDKGDMFFVPPELMPDGWSYQWNVVSVVGSPDAALKHMNRMYANGWRAVPADRHVGRWTPVGHKGDIVVEGLRLEERPISLTEEAQEQDISRAKRQMSDRDESLMGGKASVRNMPQGFAMGGKYRGTGGDLRMSIDPAVDIPAPSHDLADPGE